MLFLGLSHIVIRGPKERDRLETQSFLQNLPVGSTSAEHLP